jgi:two-component system alkaline phosphatase synthesis response regulator PhoP
MQKRILIIEDNEDTRLFLTQILSREFEVLAAENAIIGIDYARNQSPDLILLDVMLPHLSGLDACQMLKKDEKTRHIPIIILSAKSSVGDITSGLNVGADDYVAKPFDFKELMARVNARIRQGAVSGRELETLIIGELKINPLERHVFYKSKQIDLTLTEFDILRFLVSQAGQVVSRKAIIDQVWGENNTEINDRTIDVHIRSIRKKIPEITKHLASVYGVGYRYDR